MTRAEDRRLEPAVVAELYQKFAPDLRAFLLGVLRNDDLAAEALQATFTKAVEVGKTARSETIRGWLFQVAYNEAMRLKRRRGVEQKSFEQLARSGATSAASAAEESALRELIIRVRAALDDLPVEQQQVVRMRIYDGKTFAVIAQELNAPLGTVLTRMRLALKRLAAQFEGEQP